MWKGQRYRHVPLICHVRSSVSETKCKRRIRRPQGFTVHSATRCFSLGYCGNVHIHVILIPTEKHPIEQYFRPSSPCCKENMEVFILPAALCMNTVFHTQTHTAQSSHCERTSPAEGLHFEAQEELSSLSYEHVQGPSVTFKPTMETLVWKRKEHVKEEAIKIDAFCCPWVKWVKNSDEWETFGLLLLHFIPLKS